MNKLEGTFKYWHENPPNFFNPSYNPNAKKAMRLAVEELESEGWYENTTRQERINSGILHKRYEQKLAILDKDAN